MNIRIPGTFKLHVSGPYPEDLINRLSAQGIPFRDYRKEEEFTASFSCSDKDIDAIEKAAWATQCQVQILSHGGFRILLHGLKSRILMMVLLLLLTTFSYNLQSRVWFLEVTGNELIHQDEILRILEERGVGFGTAFEHIDMELLRNEILGQIPQLDYITINTSGGFAEVVVRERIQQPVSAAEIGPRNLVSCRDGVVEEVIITEGTALVSPGDVVTKGQVLISGVTNLERVTVLTGAEGEVFARTFSSGRAVIEGVSVEKIYTGRKKHGISLSFGKNTINFFKTSGISYDNYDKMTHRIILTLPGGYQLPITLTISSFREYTVLEQSRTKGAAEQLLLQSIRRNMTENMSAGQILREELTLSRKKGSFELSGVLECREEIGRSVEIKE